MTPFHRAVRCSQVSFGYGSTFNFWPYRTQLPARLKRAIRDVLLMESIGWIYIGSEISHWHLKRNMTEGLGSVKVPAGGSCIPVAATDWTLSALLWTLRWADSRTHGSSWWFEGHTQTSRQISTPLRNGNTWVDCNRTVTFALICILIRSIRSMGLDYISQTIIL